MLAGELLIVLEIIASTINIVPFKVKVKTKVEKHLSVRLFNRVLGTGIYRPVDRIFHGGGGCVPHEPGPNK